MKKYTEFVNGIMHRPQVAYSCLKELQGALELKRRITKAYLNSSEYEESYAEYFGIGTTKGEARELRRKLIKEISQTILSGKTEYGDEMMPDNYARLFHALAILKVEKNSDVFQGTTENMLFNSMYMLWGIDDGSDEIGETIEDAMWYMAEEIKGRSGRAKSKCILGVKCKST